MLSNHRTNNEDILISYINFQLVENRPTDGERGKQFNSFYFRTNRRWNNLPSKVVNAETVNAFKNQLDEEWKDVPSKYTFGE